MSKKLKAIGLALVIFFLLFFFIKPYNDFLTKTLKISPIVALISMDSLKKYDNQVNILILGIAGLHYEGPDLSDSIIVASYNLSTNKLTTISVPRDVWSDTLKDRINSAYAYGEAKQPGGGGLKLAKAEVEAIVGIPIQYAAVIDFDNFIQFIDTIGGVDVQVDRSFTDHQFPIPGKADDLCGGDPIFACRYETVSFQAGSQHMDGKTALNFVRSRHAEGAEGNDFARNARQQKVIDAIKIKMIAILKSGSLKKVEEAYKTFDKSVQRDITNQQLAIIGKNVLFKNKFSQNKIELAQDFFIVPDYLQYYGKYVLIPPNEDYTAVHGYISCELKNPGSKSCEALKPKQTL